MNHRHCHPLPVPLLLLLTAVFLLAGCARSAPIQYFQLAMAHDQAKAEFTVPKGITLGLGPVRLPEYLDRPQIVMRASANRLRLADGERWAEPLADNLTRVLSEDLAALLGTDRILLHPWPRTRSIDCQITVEVLRFESGPDGAATLAARWTVLGKDGQVLLPARRSSFSVPVTDQGQEGVVAALSLGLLRLAREIAVELPPLLPH